MHLVQGDVTDLPSLIATMKRERVDRVLHLAASILQDSERDPLRAAQVNVVGTGNVYEAALALDVERVCAASTIGVLGNADLYGHRAVTEDDPPAPRTPYGATKLLTEIMTKTYRDARGLDATVIRPALTYGIGRLTGAVGAFNLFVKNLAVGRPAALKDLGQPHHRVQPMYIKDMAATFIAATLNESVPRHLYNAPVTGSFRLDEILGVARELVPGADVSIEDSGASGRVVPMVDGSRAIADLEVDPAYSLRDGMAEMIDWYRSGS